MMGRTRQCSAIVKQSTVLYSGTSGAGTTSAEMRAGPSYRAQIFRGNQAQINFERRDSINGIWDSMFHRAIFQTTRGKNTQILDQPFHQYTSLDGETCAVRKPILNIVGYDGTKQILGPAGSPKSHSEFMTCFPAGNTQILDQPFHQYTSLDGETCAVRKPILNIVGYDGTEQILGPGNHTVNIFPKFRVLCFTKHAIALR
jgi:hypothetical protein